MKRIYLFLFLIPILFIFKAWFFPGLLTSGDFWPLFPSMFDSRSLPLPAWDFNHNFGIGGFSGPFLWIHLNLSWPNFIFGQLLGLHWEIIERIAWLFPFLAVGIISPYLLFKKFFKSHAGGLFASFIFIANTYILMIVGGGQAGGVGMGYVLAPLVLYFFTKLLDGKAILRYGLLAGLVLGIQTIYDIRLSYITFGIVILYILFNFSRLREKKTIFGLLLSTVVVLSLNLFWLIPTIVVHIDPFVSLGQAYSSSAAVKFFSFAKLENTIALLHPNWPENLFGKVSFMKAEFLVLPIIAFSSLLFVNKKEKHSLIIIFFALIGLLGMFLAKGANAPLGEIYVFLFDHVPGFILFRDPTKWYVLVAIAFSILIPYSSLKINEFLKNQIKRVLFYSFLVLVFTVLLFPVIRPGLGGMFVKTAVPYEYKKFELLVSHSPEFYRTFWLPNYQRFSFYSKIHPSISGSGYFGDNSLNKTLSRFEDPEMIGLLQAASVKYVVVPYDSEGEIFLKDREYDENSYLNTIKKLDTIPFLSKNPNFKKLAVYEIVNYKKHFWGSDSSLSFANVSMKNTSHYSLKLTNPKPGSDIIFTDSYDPNWYALDGDSRIKSQKYGKFNSFRLQSNNPQLEIIYAPQQIVNTSSMLSLSVLIFVLIGIAYTFIKQKK